MFNPILRIFINSCPKMCLAKQFNTDVDVGKYDIATKYTSTIALEY